MSSIIFKNEESMTKNISRKIGENIQKALNEKKITRAQLAEILHGSHQKVSSWINGKHMPAVDVLCTIMELTGKDANYFFGYPSCTGNNHIVGDNNHNINQNVGGFTELAEIKQDLALMKQAILELQRKKK